MTADDSALTGLLAECDGSGIRLLLAEDGGLTIDAPRDALTPPLLERLKAHKPALLASLRIERGAARAKPSDGGMAPKPVCPCGSITWRDVVLTHPPHNGASTRRDCGDCNRFLDFPIWYGTDTLHNE